MPWLRRLWRGRWIRFCRLLFSVQNICTVTGKSGLSPASPPGPVSPFLFQKGVLVFGLLVPFFSPPFSLVTCSLLCILLGLCQDFTPCSHCEAGVAFGGPPVSATLWNMVGNVDSPGSRLSHGAVPIVGGRWHGHTLGSHKLIHRLLSTPGFPLLIPTSSCFWVCS